MYTALSSYTYHIPCKLNIYYINYFTHENKQIPLYITPNWFTKKENNRNFLYPLKGKKNSSLHQKNYNKFSINKIKSKRLFNRSIPKKKVRHFLPRARKRRKPKEEVRRIGWQAN